MPSSVALSVTPSPPSPLPHSRLARSHNRRFHIRFPGVDSEEHLLNYYSCALVADILLQGLLYITENYFAFYSNIFGRKTQILIPVGDVIKVTKERTAKIIPNAVGLYTEEGKYVFGSLLSRNTTYRLMHHVWLKSADPDSTEEDPTASDNSEPGSSDEPIPPPPTPEPLALADTDDLMIRRLSRRKSEMFPRISAKAAARRHQQCCSSSSAPSVVDQIMISKCRWDCSRGKDCFNRIEENSQSDHSNPIPKTTLILMAATLLLIVLFLFATVLVYRVSIAHNRGGIENNWSSKANHRVNYLDLLKQQQEAVEDEILRITTNLKNRVNELGKVRQSLDRLIGMASHSSCHSNTNNVKEPNPDFAPTN